MSTERSGGKGEDMLTKYDVRPRYLLIEAVIDHCLKPNIRDGAEPTAASMGIAPCSRGPRGPLCDKASNCSV